ncbi:hypothetical protein EMIHUDRAFT_311357 [Emiliania huxleyi CCMP1516]|uniref:Uncharacterized protein n=2 Tax=Emiliania huxleyi TaxID=2903 RepID=A0A0D3INW0_EMIH1|nr:hypothetical protein EMIHUDRAFT_311357 [Emiliania huxleyi CCMP1516]EOD12945.1 hypothetical protein EMIHUDRAFT_311357 [Emiliania huxleyi CCMP1516]|eukprot:XP_005765374.1 hypothetical protein EMIHUDRAFT_311357 [Emiliania huxleyi CCMP1516]
MTPLGVSLELGEAARRWSGLRHRPTSRLSPVELQRSLLTHASRRSLPPYLPPSHAPSSRLLEPLGLPGDAPGYAYLERATDVVEGQGEGWPASQGWPHISFPRPGASWLCSAHDQRRAGGASRRHCSASCSRRDETPLSKTRGRSALLRKQQREVIALQKQLALLGCTPPAARAASAVAAKSPASAPEGYNTSPPGAGEGGGEGASSHHRPSASTPFLV